MEPLQASSIKIKKNQNRTNPSRRNFICGGCDRTYGSYPALYLHIKRKHNGIRPPNTKTSRLISLLSTNKVQTGRPQKPSLNIDDVSDHAMDLEESQLELFGFLGEKLNVVSRLDSKPKLEFIINEILNVTNPLHEEAIDQLKKQTEDLYKELIQESDDSDEVEMDLETFGELDNENSLKILCWFLIWLGRYLINIEALKDMIIIFAKIWVVIKKMNLKIQDLDNKLVWNEAVMECESYLSLLTCFAKDKALISEFLSKLCHLIGKTFE